MKLINLKYKLKNHDNFESRLSTIGVEFSSVFWVHDRVYLPRGYKKGQNFPRFIVRTEMRAIDRPAKYYLILRRHIEDSGIDISETTEISDYVATVGMILNLGFELATEVSRRREEAKTKQGDNFYIDKIDGLEGYYGKIERIIKPDAKVSAERESLSTLIESLNPGSLISSPYFELLSK